jgi:DNA-binding response OmpR family regulator
MKKKSQTVYLVEVLAIDDEPKKKAIIKDILKAQGFKVTWCTNWKDVDELLTERISEDAPLPNIALVDMHFKTNILHPNPALEGVAIVGELRKKYRLYGKNPIPTIGFTARESYLLRQEMIEAGASDFITSAEWERPQLFTRRILECVQNGMAENARQDLNSKEIGEVEYQIVKRVLDLTEGNDENAARLLNWPKDYLEKVKAKYRTEVYCNAK